MLSVFNFYFMMLNDNSRFFWYFDCTYSPWLPSLPCYLLELNILKIVRNRFMY